MHLLTEATIAEQAVSGEIWVIGHPALACVMLSPKPGELYLHKLAVDPGHQRRGLARALIAQAEARAKAMGLPALTLMTRVELVENHAVFRSLGFVETGRTAHPGYDRPTTIRFAKPLI